MDEPAEPTVREYVQQDLEACLRIFDSNVPHFFRLQEREEYEGFLRNLPGPYFLVVDPSAGAVACGGYAISGESDVADLCWGMVVRGLHGRGFGRTLTEHRIRNIRNDDRARRVALNTSQHTAAFYERLGFRTTRIYPDGYAPGLDRHDLVLELPR